MKSLKICALALVLTMLFASMPAFAADTVDIKFELVSDLAEVEPGVVEIEPGENVTVDLYVKPVFTGENATANKAYNTHTFSFGANIVYPVGVSTAKGKIISGITGYQRVTSSLAGATYAGANFANAEGAELLETLVKITFTIANAVAGESYNFSLASNCAITVDAFDEDAWGAANGAPAANLDKSATLTVKVAGGNDEPATVVPTAATLTDVATSTEANGWQKGQAVAMTFNTADLAGFAGMKWKLNIKDAVAKFAPVDFNADTIAAIGDAVQFVASFVVNTEDDENGVKIESIEAGFCDGEKNVVAKTAAVEISPVPAE